MTSISMHRIVAGVMSPEELQKVIKMLHGLGFDVRTRAHFMMAAQLLRDASPLETVSGMDDEQFSQLTDQTTSYDPPLDTKYNPDEWSEEEKRGPGAVDLENIPQEQKDLILKRPPGRKSMKWLVTSATNVDLVMSLVQKLDAAGLRMESREVAYNALHMLATTQSANATIAAIGSNMVAGMSDEEYAGFLKGQAPSAPPQSKNQPATKVAPSITKPAPSAPAAPQATPAAPGQKYPGQHVLPATSMMQFSRTQFDDTQKGKIKQEMHGKYDEMAEQIKKVLPDFSKIFLGDDAPVLVKNKQKPTDPAKDVQNTRIKGGQFVANYGKGMTEGMLIGTTADKKLVVVSFPDGMGDTGGKLQVWDPVKDDVRMSAHQAVIRVAMHQLLAQMGNAQDAQGNPINPGDLVQDPNNSTMQNGGQVVNVMQNGAVIYQNDQGQKVMKDPGTPMEVIKHEGPDGQIQQSPDVSSGAAPSGVGGSNMIQK